ncbi:MAG: DUF4397 domain-containing protein [Gemmatimonadetes bacterium]|nr:DUF4397 domain-containing protein [Gemmatimonadota bacterium]
MRTHLVLATLATLAGVAGCAADSPTESPKLTDTGVRVINGFDAPVDVVIDGAFARAGLGAGELGSFGTAAGDRSVQVRLAGGTVAALAVRVGTGHLSAVAATRLGSGTLSLQSLDDTNAVVPAGATKLRVLHLASKAGEVQVWRTQPDYQTPIRWAFPFNYNAVNTYYQSSPGAWEVRVWTDTSSYRPGDARGWAAAVDTARVTLSGGGKKTVVILDAGAGRVKLEVID